jgi:hypothetical protein
MTNSVTVLVPSTGSVGQDLAVSGTVSPAADVVTLALSQQNATLPSGPFVAATTTSGAYAGTVTPIAPGTWYVWALDPTTGISAVSSAISVPNPALPLVAAVPITTQQGASLLGGSAAGETPDELPSAAPASDTDTAIVAQSGKTLLAQTFAAIWTWIQGKLPSYLLPQVAITSSTALSFLSHNGRILVIEATGVTLSVNAGAMNAGFACDVVNASSGTVTLSGITRSAGGTTIPAGGQGRIVAYAVSGTTYLNTNA